MHQPLIVIVDDDLSFLEFTKDVLEDAGYNVRCCQDMAAAYDVIRTQRPDLILLDLHLSKGLRNEGKVLLDLLRATPILAHIPVIICSGDRAFLAAKGERLQKKGCLVLPKPFELPMLFDLIDRALGSAPKERSQGERVVP
ncbi:MAG: hypothetical protein KatS3mg057_2743 [Herpetosiphonaceae bacterium]|nr:MAG: hypothetical protein KatS3mg057_2743 [Herpetosiphonaceae bacterium]